MTMTVGTAWVPRRTPGVLSAEVDGDLVLMHPVDYAYFGLTGTGMAVWERIDGERSVQAIVDDLSSTYDGTAETIRRDVVDFLGGLTSARLVDAPG